MERGPDASARAWLDAGLGLEERVRALLDDLSPAERASVLLGDFGPLTTRGLPAPHYVDAGTGLRDVAGATAFPAGIALAASFDPQLAEEVGAAVGAEARASGYSVVLGPTLDLARDPRGGRIPEAFGEDPWLAGALAAAHVRGLQAQHVIAQLKHLVAYNGEGRRTGYHLRPDDPPDAVDVRVPAGVLADAYLRPFRAAVEAGAWSIMGSYNRVNGVYACENADLLSLPRREWGWQGFYCPDFLFAVRDDAKALEAGLDLPALGGAAGRTPAMVAAADPASVERAVGNVVRALIGSGLADDPLPEPSVPSSAGHLALAERVAVASTVLLRNESAALPFGDDVTSLALIGPSGEDVLHVVGGSAAVSLDPGRLVTAAEGVRRRAGARRVEVVQGSLGDAPLPLVPPDAFTLPDGSGGGVEVEFTDRAGHRWHELLDRIDHAVDPTDPLARWPRRWRTRLTSTVSGEHRISLLVGGRVTLAIDGRTVLAADREAEQFIHGPHYPLQTVVVLQAGVPADVEIDWEPGPALVIPPMGIGPTLRLGWQPPDDSIEQAAAAAARSDAAVVVVTMASGEGMDRDTLDLPGEQDALVRRVAAANPRTVVVLNTPGAVLMPWLDEVAAVLQVWYPGERFGSALAAMLFGDAEPGGRLPLTFPRAVGHLPGGDRRPGAVPAELDYGADGGVGYRAPGVREHGSLFPFGHGLSYAGSRCEVRSIRAEEDAVRVALTATNPGDRGTVHVVQLYLELHGREAPELVGVARLRLPAGSSAEEEAVVPAEAFARWDDSAGRRVPVPGDHRLRVARDSADPGTAGDVRVRRAGDGVRLEVPPG